MFRTKSKTEQAREAAAARLETAAAAASGVGSNAQLTAADLKARAAELRAQAAPRVEHARDTARVYAAEAAPRVNEARDTFVEEVVPKLASALATVLATAAATKAAASEAADRAPDAYHVLKGDAVAKPAKRGGGKGLVLLGLIAAGAAALAWKKSTEKKDPWATAGAYTPPSSGRDASGGVHAGSSDGSSLADKVTDLASAAKEKAAAAGAAVKERAGEGKDKAAEAEASVSADADAAAFGGEQTSETASDGNAWTDAGEWAEGSAPSTSGTSEGSDLSTPHLDEGRNDSNT